MGEDGGERLKGVYTARDQNELTGRYDVWAADYDRDIASFGYKNPALAVGMATRHLDPSASPILDAGAGTGIVGELLHIMGYRGLTALDMSEGMLEVARARGVYDAVTTGVLGEALPFDDDLFAAAFAIGVLTVGHAPADSLDELVRVVRPGGRLICSITTPAWAESGFGDKVEALVADGRLTRTDETADYRVLPGAPDEASLESRIYVFTIA